MAKIEVKTTYIKESEEIFANFRFWPKVLFLTNIPNFWKIMGFFYQDWYFVPKIKFWTKIVIWRKKIKFWPENKLKFPTAYVYVTFSAYYKISCGRMGVRKMIIMWKKHRRVIREPFIFWLYEVCYLSTVF